MSNPNAAGAVLALAALGIAGTARAGVGYDNITGNDVDFSVHGDNLEYADDTTLDSSFGLTITSVSMLVRTPLGQGDYSGTLRVRIFGAGAAAPGAELGSAQVQIFIADGAKQTFTVSFAGLTVPSASIWTSFQFMTPNSPLPGVLAGGVPSVGSTTQNTAYRTAGTGSWKQSTTLANPFAIRINTVPSPAPAVLFIAGCAAAGWLRRR